MQRTQFHHQVFCPTTVRTWHVGMANVNHVCTDPIQVKDIPDDLFIELVSLKKLHLDLPHVLQLRMNTNDRHKLLQVTC